MTSEEPHTASDDRTIRQDLFCQQCGYNLRGLTGDNCPECGGSLDTVRTTVSQIPWVHRSETGRFRAYWKTVWLVMFRQHRFGEEMAREVDYADAQSFRWVTILHAYLPILVATIAFYLLAPSTPFTVRPIGGPPAEVGNAAFEALWPIAVMHVAVVLCLAAITGVPSYFFHPRGLPVELQNRAIALSYYASGALAITALPIAAGLASYFFSLDSQWGLFLILLAATVPFGQLVAWYLDLIHISRRLLPQFDRRTVAVAVCVPGLWLLLTGLILVGVPALALYVVIIVASFG